MDYKKAVTEKKGELTDLYKRMDADKDLVNLTKYVLADKDGNPVPDIINVTLNDPAYFAAYVESRLNAASEQVVVESDEKGVDTAYIEDLVRVAFTSADARLLKQGRWQLNPFLDQQMCRRGRAAARCIFQLNDDGILVPEITYWDTRYVTNDFGKEGLKWAANEGLRQKGALEAQYADELAQYKVTITKSADFLDIWSTEHNEVWVTGKKILEQPHTFGFCPVCIQIVSLGSMLSDKDSMKFQGESLFFLIRDIIPELNRLASMAQTTNFSALQGALQWESKEGQSYKKIPAYKDIKRHRAVTAADIGGGAKPIPVQDVVRAFAQMHSIMEMRMQRGSLTAFDLGTFTQPMSAVALVEIGEGRNQIFEPRLGARGLLKDQLAEMIIEQIIQIGGSVELGTRGHKKTFDTGKLLGEYQLAHKYFIKSPAIDAGKVSIAAAYGNLIPNRAKRREVLQREDPLGDEQQLHWEEAERLNPRIKLRRIIKDLIDMGENEEAIFLLDDLGVSLERFLAGDTGEEVKPEKEEEPTQIMPMFGGRGSRAKQPAPEGEE